MRFERVYTHQRRDKKSDYINHTNRPREDKNEHKHTSLQARGLELIEQKRFFPVSAQLGGERGIIRRSGTISSRGMFRPSRSQPIVDRFQAIDRATTHPRNFDPLGTRRVIHVTLTNCAKHANYIIRQVIISSKCAIATISKRGARRKAAIFHFGRPCSALNAPLWLHPK